MKGNVRLLCNMFNIRFNVKASRKINELRSLIVNEMDVSCNTIHSQSPKIYSPKSEEPFTREQTIKPFIHHNLFDIIFFCVCNFDPLPLMLCHFISDAFLNYISDFQRP